MVRILLMESLGPWQRLAKFKLIRTPPDVAKSHMRTETRYRRGPFNATNVHCVPIFMSNSEALTGLDSTYTRAAASGAHRSSK